MQLCGVDCLARQRFSSNTAVDFLQRYIIIIIMIIIDTFSSQVETREDEEQSVKLAEILELLLAAGYFRARIKGLSPFDKVYN